MSTDRNEEVLKLLAQLDGTTRSAVSMVTGMSYAELDELGGFGDDSANPR